MLKSALLSNLIVILCQPIEMQRTRLYVFYPEQAGLCFRAAEVMLAPMEFQATLGEIERDVTKSVEAWAKEMVPVYLYAPLIAGYATLVEQKFVIPVGPVAFTLHMNGVVGMRWQYEF